jgi:hypothetical protein
MSADKSKETAAKKIPVENKAVDRKPETAAATSIQSEKPTTKTESKSDVALKRQGMGEGQKPVSKAYKENWNAIFGKKKKR